MSLFNGENIRFIIGGVILLVGLFMLLAFTSHIFTGCKDQSAIQGSGDFVAENYAGKLGAYTAYHIMDRLFGVSSYFIPIFIICLGVKIMRVYKIRLWKVFLHSSFLLVWSSVALSLLPFKPSHMTCSLGGLHGDHARDLLYGSIGQIPTIAVVAGAALCYLIYLSSETVRIIRRLMRPHELLRGGWDRLHHRSTEGEGQGGEAPTTPGDAYSIEGDEGAQDDYKEEIPVQLGFETAVGEDRPKVILDTPAPSTPDLTIDTPEAPETALGDLAPYDPHLDLENYRYPTVDLLKKYADDDNSVDMAEQNENKNRIVTILRNFGVEITAIKATIGPTITLYEITPAPGIKISKIRNLEDDIALSLSALGIRIIAPIPGKGTIGIEVPNKNPRIVSMESILHTRKFQESHFELPIALGKTITNEVFMVDLAKLPHLLVAGATGQGKSVGLNAIITSLLYKKHPSELKIVMIDPKKVEFSVYAPIEKHFLAMIPDGEDPIITDVTKVVQTLKSLCALMDHRYDLLKIAKVRNIKEYNAKFKARQLNPENGHEFMPYIVVIIDEFGDLIMTAGKEVELPIARIAQLARAVGIHMVIATQRPTTNIITGTIKANFPARMAFKVMSRVDSQTILDRTGANQLVGKGDMLFLLAGDPVRVQCAFVDTPEVERITEHIASQQGYVRPYELPEVLADGDGGTGTGIADDEPLDPMFADAARLIVIHQSGSTSLIQRKFSIGYNRAGRLMDQLERAGIVGPARGAKPRDVLVSDEIELDAKLGK
jgi:S-DNA-T family DNA segregation ATPase FtsK/SpoIIIE